MQRPEIQRLKDKARKAAMAPPKLSPSSHIAIMLQFRDQRDREYQLG